MENDKTEKSLLIEMADVTYDLFESGEIELPKEE
jgi:hypothetical protein